ncbi:MAG TPA: hypothetical protein VK907_04680, partial [Phnomibacter sp.]|nr:hypothetical protein [Phnomibacter sp.]
LPPALRNCFHKSLYGLLKPGGHIMLEAFNPQQLKYNSGGPKDPDLLMTSERLFNDFSQFQVIDNFELRTELMEGTYHQGLAETVRFHAIKVP